MKAMTTDDGKKDEQATSDTSAQSECNGLLDEPLCKIRSCKWHDDLMTYNCGGEDKSGDPLYVNCKIKKV